jgi:VIT1/CCC1 family predicted Fe2+/Mn2+ transporter
MARHRGTPFFCIPHPDEALVVASVVAASAAFILAAEKARGSKKSFRLLGFPTDNQ